MNRVLGFFFKAVLPMVVIAFAVMTAKQLIASRPDPPKQQREDKGLLVETLPVEITTRRAAVRAQGIVRSSRETIIQSEVGGRILSLHPRLELGGEIRRGDELFTIDPRDYQLNVRESRTAIAEARANVKLEQGQQQIARKEFALFKDDLKQEDFDTSLALRKPQEASARAKLRASQVRLDKAQLSLERTVVHAPFNAIVSKETVEEGQLVSPQTQVATLVGTDTFWVQVSIPPGDLKYISIPGVNAERGARATIWQDLGNGERIQRSGRVLRLLPEIDTVGRMARVIIAVQDPLNRLARDPSVLVAGQSFHEMLRSLANAAALGVPSPGDLPLLLGAYVHVEIETSRDEKLVEIPRRALRDGNTVMVYRDGKLAITTVTIGWRYPEHVLVRSGLQPGDRVILNNISAPVEGMALRLRSDVKTDADTSTPDAGGQP